MKTRPESIVTLPNASASLSQSGGKAASLAREAQSMSWQDQVKGKALEWLLERDSPGVRYLALRDLVDLEKSDHELRAARRTAHRQGPIAAILQEMDQRGYWVKPGPATNPSIAPLFGRSSCLLSLARRFLKIDESLRHVPMFSAMPSPSVDSSPCPVPHPEPWTVCKGTCAGLCWNWAATIPV